MKVDARLARQAERVSLSFVGNTDHLVASSGDRTIRLHRSGGMNDVRAFLNGNSYFDAAVATSDGKWVIGRSGRRSAFLELRKRLSAVLFRARSP